jgi:hypothetical protein
VRLRAPWTASSLAIPGLAAAAALLGIAVLVKYGIVSGPILKAHRDEIDPATKLISSIILICGAAVAYVRFFKGRLLHPKLSLGITATGTPLGDRCVYSIEIEIINRGAVAAWDYALSLQGTVFGGDPVDYSDRLRDDLSEVGPDGIRSVDVGETAYAHAAVDLTTNGRPVTFRAVLRMPDGTVWARSVMAAGSAKSEPARTLWIAR